MQVSRNTETEKKSFDPFQNFRPSSGCLPTCRSAVLFLCAPASKWGLSVDLFIYLLFIVFKWLVNSWPQQAVPACLSKNESVQFVMGSVLTNVCNYRGLSLQQNQYTPNNTFEKR